MFTLRNFINIIRRYKSAFFLNVIGLCVALVVAALIVMQIRYDLTFDPGEPEKDNICLLSTNIADGDIGPVALSARPMEELVKNRPEVAATCLMAPSGSSEFIEVRNSGGRAHTALKVQALPVTAGITDVFTFRFTESTPGLMTSTPNSVIIPQSVAQKLFPDSSALGMELKMSTTGRTFTVTGVYEDFPSNSTLSNYLFVRLEDWRDVGIWGNFNYNLMVRLMPAPAGGAEEYREAVASAIAQEYLKIMNDEMPGYLSSENLLSFISIRDLHFSRLNLLFDPFPKADPQQLLIFLAIAVLVMVIACINLINFYTAMAPLRVKSINTLKVLGSSRMRLCLSIVCETTVLAVLAWGLSLLCILGLKDSAVAGLIDPEISLSGQYPALLVTLGMVVLAGLVSGLYPAAYITSFQPAVALKGSMALSPKGRKIRSALVGFQFVVSLILITCIGVIFLQNMYLQNLNPGYEKNRLLTVRLEGQVNPHDYNQLRNRILNIPGVERCSFASFLLSSGDNIMTWGRDVNQESINFNVVAVWDGFLETIGATLLEGRDFTVNDHNKWIFNDMARKTYGLTLETKISSNEEIVGFVSDIQAASLGKSLAPLAFFCEDCTGEYYYHGVNDDVVYIRLAEGVMSGSVIADVKAAVGQILQETVPDYPFEVLSNDQVFEQTYESEQNATLMISVFCAVAVIISIIGVFCLVMFDSESRRKEIAVRKVMGAEAGTIVRSFIRTYIVILIVCHLLATPVAVYFSRLWLESFAERVAFPWWMVILSFAVIAAITVLTVFWQSSKAAHENPILNLRSE